MATEPFLGQLMPVGFNFAPQGWAQCDGALLPINPNAALFSLLGTTYGGNGTTTFGLPDLRGRVLIHQGQGPGLSPYVLGQVSGAENITLITSQIPSHNHNIGVNNDTATIATSGSGAYLNSKTESGESIMSSATGSPVTANTGSVSLTGNNQPHSNIQPYLTVMWIIALAGIYPSRS